MGRMLEAYLAFAKGDGGEQPAPTDMGIFLEELKADAERHGHKASAVFYGHPMVTVRPAAFRRCLANLVSNAARFAPSISITGHRDHRWLTVTVDDDGPGIPPGERRAVFLPFRRAADVAPKHDLLTIKPVRNHSSRWREQHRRHRVGVSVADHVGRAG